MVLGFCKHHSKKKMEKPNYVLRTNEAVLMPVNQGNGLLVFKICVWIVVALTVLGSIVFQDNLFSELSWTSRIFLIILVIGVTLYGGKKEYFPSPMELQFFDDYLVFYLPKRYYGKHSIGMQIDKMKYSDITKCVYKTRSQRIHIYGDGTATWYNYRKDGTLPDKPTERRNFKEGLIYFDIRLAPEIDFKKEIEMHSPLQVILEND